MLYGDLTSAECEAVLANECYGHLGFIGDDGKPHVLPVTYVHSGEAIYSISEEGEKIDAMRQRPEVCLQAETLQLPDKWHSVQVWGTYEELNNKDLHAIQKLIEDYWERNESNQVILTPLRDIAVTASLPTVLWRINITKITGKSGGNPPDKSGLL